MKDIISYAGAYLLGFIMVTGFVAIVIFLCIVFATAVAFFAAWEIFALPFTIWGIIRFCISTGFILAFFFLLSKEGKEAVDDAAKDIRAMLK
jgi:hypothetical protein